MSFHASRKDRLLKFMDKKKDEAGSRQATAAAAATNKSQSLTSFFEAALNIGRALPTISCLDDQPGLITGWPLDHKSETWSSDVQNDLATFLTQFGRWSGRSSSGRSGRKVKVDVTARCLGFIFGKC